MSIPRFLNRPFRASRVVLKFDTRENLGLWTRQQSHFSLHGCKCLHRHRPQASHHDLAHPKLHPLHPWQRVATSGTGIVYARKLDQEWIRETDRAWDF